jgi:hypothetical protein
MTGAAELDAYGRWEQSDDYGPIWIPIGMAVDWAPYSQGHWAWVPPWGWTWIDDAPWGFAPFHYGRWVYARNNWCWTPGARVARPVYAPALVGWIGGPRGNASVTVGGGPAVGWFPLAPREVYVPSYRVSQRYAERINITSVVNVNLIRNVFNNPQGPRDFENRRFPRAVTVVPANVMAEHRPVAPAAAQLRQAPWVRDLANAAGGAAPLLAPPIAAPRIAARNPDPRAVRPPPGAGERPAFNGRPGVTPREFTPREATRVGQSPVPQAAVSGTQPNAGRPPSYQGAPGRVRDHNAEPDNARRPPVPPPPRSAVATQLAPQEGPVVRPLPVRRGDDRREEDRRIEERRPVSSPGQAQAQPQFQPRAAQQAPAPRPPPPPAVVRPPGPVVVPRQEATPTEQRGPRPDEQKRVEPREER